MPGIEKKISLGNILTIITMAGGGIFAWASLNASFADTALRVRDHEQRLRVLERNVTDGLARIETQLMLMRSAEERR